MTHTLVLGVPFSPSPEFKFDIIFFSFCFVQLNKINADIFFSFLWENLQLLPYGPKMIMLARANTTDSLLLSDIDMSIYAHTHNN